MREQLIKQSKAQSPGGNHSSSTKPEEANTTQVSPTPVNPKKGKAEVIMEGNSGNVILGEESNRSNFLSTCA